MPWPLKEGSGANTEQSEPEDVESKHAGDEGLETCHPRRWDGKESSAPNTIRQYRGRDGLRPTPLGPWGGLTADCAPRLARLPIKAIGWWVASSASWTPSPSSNMQVPLAARQRLPEIEGVMKPTASENTDFQHPGALFHFLRTRVVVRLLLPGPSKRRRALVW